MQAEAGTGLTLYSYWRSSAAYRVRIALNLKGLTYAQVPVHLVKNGGEQHAQAFRIVNPQGLVPVLLHDGEVITQSLAICEYLDERFPEPALLPGSAVERARVRSMALQIACEIHPLNNLRVLNYLQDHCGESIDRREWMSNWMHAGFTALEQQLSDRPAASSRFCAGQVGLFECLLVPQVYNAERFGIDLSDFSQIVSIVGQCRQMEAFMAAAPENQADAVVA